MREQLSLKVGDAFDCYGEHDISPCGTYRFSLTKWWPDEGLKPGPVVWLMTNPAKATKDINDMTLLRTIHFTQSWGYSGELLVNFYPYRTPDMKELWRWAKWEENGPDYYARDALQANLGVIKEAAREAALRVVAFGAQAPVRDPIWMEECLEAFTQPSDIGADETLYCLGANKDGWPLHPMARGKWRVPDHKQPEVWQNV